MKYKLLWLITGILFAGFLYVQAVIRMQIDDGFGLVGMGIELMANIILVVGLSAAIGALTAIIPNKKGDTKRNSVLHYLSVQLLFVGYYYTFLARRYF